MLQAQEVPSKEEMDQRNRVWTLIDEIPDESLDDAEEFFRKIVGG